MFQHTAARRRLGPTARSIQALHLSFNTQPPEGGWLVHSRLFAAATLFQHTAARRRLGRDDVSCLKSLKVSTHSRPKAAGCRVWLVNIPEPGFNTQPPEGGWGFVMCWVSRPSGFQHTAARRRLADSQRRYAQNKQVSTHSRPKAAGFLLLTYVCVSLSFNTQPPEGGWPAQDSNSR